MNRYFLLDCNNFFVSCERVFNPTLRNKPVVVLSSGDACIIARSNEVKALGVPMGGALCKYADLLKKHNVEIYSANFPLYGDMSSRVMQTITEIATDIEVYSVDEAFFFVSDYNFPITYDERYYYTAYGHHIKNIVKQRTGIPVSIGIGPTKTLTKIANRIAKKNQIYDGVFDISSRADVDQLLATVAIEDVWGIGYRYAKMLRAKKITNAQEFKYMDDAWVRKHMSIGGLKTLHELRGTVCLDLDVSPATKQSITVSRLFGMKTGDVTHLKEAMAAYVTTAAQKLRAQHARAQQMTIFAVTNRYHESQNYFKSVSIELPLATAYTPTLIAAAHAALKKIYVTGLLYKKVGVILYDLVPDHGLQLHTYATAPDVQHQTDLMHLLDKANSKWGRDTVFFAAAGAQQSWKMRQAYKSQCFTTSWHELLTISV